MRATKQLAKYSWGITVIAALCCMAILTAINTNAQTITTDPVGMITLTIGGTNDAPGSNPHYSQLGLGMTQLPVSRGNATVGAGANQVAVNVPLNAGSYNMTADGNFAYFIEYTSDFADAVTNAYAGTMDDIVSNDTANVYTAHNDATYIGAGSTYKIYPHWTLGTVFGPQNQAGLLGGSGSGSADNIQVWNPNAVPQGYTVYYYKTSGLGGTGWRSGASSSVNVSNAVLYIDQGIVAVRRTSPDVNVVLLGAVKLGTTISPIVSNGLTFVSNVYPDPVTLAQTGLYTGSPANGLLGGSGSGSADNVQVWVPSTQGYTVYYYKTSGLGGTGWRSGASSSIDASTNTIPLGGFGLIVRRAGNGPFNWYAPQPFSN